MSDMVGNPEARFSHIAAHIMKGEFSSNIWKTCPCNVYPLVPQFNIGKLGYKGVFVFLSRTQIAGTP